MTFTSTFLKRFLRFPSTTRQSLHCGMAVKSVSSTARGLTYYWQEHVENIEKYRTGGYHPIHLGDEFSNGRYQVIHKLGWGSFSTVWLAKDRVRNRYVALKVIIANASEENSEVKIMRHLHQGNLSHPGRSFILSLLDDFRIDGPNGQHQCIVTEVVGNSLRLAKESIQHEIFPLIAARIIAPQLAQGMAYIHSCGILHGGKNFLSSLHWQQVSPGLTWLGSY